MLVSGERVAPAVPTDVCKRSGLPRAGLGSSEEGVQRRLAGVAETIERGSAQRVVFSSPAVVLVPGTDLHPSCQVCH